MIVIEKHKGEGMMERDYFREFIILWVKTIILYIISGYIFGIIQGGGFYKDAAIVLPTILFGMTFFNKVVRFNLFGNSDAVIIFWVLKVMCSAAIGIIAFPIVNVYYIIMIIRSLTILVRNKEGDHE